ncbi:hypothetical protein A1O7_01469 [Cladophialophora yegresii CBS 114405]|uniref:Uncharacterized protein n=1 Tax=Cladophialophora yegresii CBS 114405 TaxID=1182544 RepID=W9X3R3_9EURO|nr:uncharacterized protein A1O7_01469 [Cladophialophora yegresii CBS 114405]EXJ65129.1 hypothetical protein A1O7_01469 [Cladophialophora yegresii CBS 114405]
MWLLNTTTLELHEFPSNPPPYAILSHTWGKEEVLYQELGTPGCKRKEGYRKIEGCCAQAKADGLEYAWVDTCCIDKRSSSELSEAINSMFRWYSEAHVCYVHLSDVDNVHLSRSFRDSRWWTRGWTLQELLAPMHVVFYDRSWREMGTKMSMLDQIVVITGISRRQLSLPASVMYVCAAEKMLWASRRETARTEDVAYCLMGIFDINMPLLYGEGPRAFQRLQSEILTKTGDQSILAWTSKDTARAGPDLSIPFASSPASFSNTSFERVAWDATPVSIDNIGISISLPLITTTGIPAPPGYPSMIGILNCCSDGRRIGIHLRLAPDATTYMRQWPSRLSPVLTKRPIPPPQRIYLSMLDYFAVSQKPPNFKEISIHCAAESKQCYQILHVYSYSEQPISSCDQFPKQRSLWRVNLAIEDWCLVVLQNNRNSYFSLILGNYGHRLWSHGVKGDLTQDASRKLWPIWKDIKGCISTEGYTPEYFNDRAKYNVDDSTLTVKIHQLPRLREPSDITYFKVEITQAKG